jgi:hypothetical protein
MAVFVTGTHTFLASRFETDGKGPSGSVKGAEPQFKKDP